jgi:sigma-E factor negative regulatory protein RseA
MSDPVKEQLSACLDGELSRTELDLVLRQVGRDSELKQAMSRYAAIGEAMRGAQAVRVSKAMLVSDIASRVAAVVEAEQPLPAVKRPAVRTAAPSWLRPVTGLAVAAGVAAVAVFVLQMGTAPGVAPVGPPTEHVAANTQVPVVTPEQQIVGDTGIPPATPSVSRAPALDARLTNYVVAHSEFSSPLGRRTVLSGVLTQDGDSDSGSPESPAEHVDQRTPSR